MKLIDINTYHDEDDGYFARFVMRKVLLNLNEWCKAKGFLINYPELVQFDSDKFRDGVNSLKMDKWCRFCNACAKLAYRPSFQRVNALLAIYSTFIDAPKVISIYKSEKELKIQEARRALRNALAEEEKLRLAYQKEKGDFYKQQLGAREGDS